MKIIPLLILLWITLTYASTAPVNLVDESPGSAYSFLTVYIHTPGLNFQPNETPPERLKVMCGAGIHAYGDEQPSGNPKWITIVGRGLTFYRFQCPPGKSEFTSRRTRGRQWKLEFLDADGTPTTEKSTYYHITDHKGVQYRIHARAGETHGKGHPVFKITKDGKKHLFEESGFDIIWNREGFITQIKDTRHVLFISNPNEKTRIYEKYRLDQLESEKIEGVYQLLTGSKPIETTRLYHPEPDKRRYMVSEEYREGVLESRTSWSKGDNPFVFTFKTEINGQEQPKQDDHYYRDEDGFLTLHRKRFRDEGAYQSEVLSIFLKNKGYRDTYERIVEDGIETLNRYEYLENFETGEFTRLHVEERDENGYWFRKKYDDLGRLIMEWTPVGEVIKEDAPKEADVAALLDLFPEASEESAAKHQKMRWIPERPPGDLDKAKEVGQLITYAFEPHFAEDHLSAEDERPRTVSTWKQGEFQKREWFAYGSRPDGTRYELREWTEEPESAFGAKENKRTNKEFHAENHPLAPGGLQSIAHADGTLEYLYYTQGSFDRKSKEFAEEERGKYLRTVATRGRLMDGEWTPGAISQTRITGEKETNLFTQKQKLQEDGTWVTL